MGSNQKPSWTVIWLRSVCLQATAGGRLCLSDLPTPSSSRRGLYQWALKNGCCWDGFWRGDKTLLLHEASTLCYGDHPLRRLISFS
jgi:hypothetical protein